MVVYTGTNWICIAVQVLHSCISLSYLKDAGWKSNQWQKERKQKGSIGQRNQVPTQAVVSPAYNILQNLSAKLTKVPLPKEQTGKVQACISTAFKAKRQELAGKENRIGNRRYGYLQSIRRDNDSTPSAQIQSILQLPRKKKRNPTLNLSGSGTPITMICQDEKLNHLFYHQNNCTKIDENRISLKKKF